MSRAFPRRGAESGNDSDGIRDLLAHLPDPGPVPDDLAARINVSLEQARSASRPVRESVPLPPRAEYPTPSARFVLGMSAAAAIVAVAGVAGLHVLAEPPANTLMAALTGPDRPTTKTAPTGHANPHVHASTTSYAAASLAGQARHLLDTPASPLAAQSTATGPLGTPTGVAECLDALGVGDATVVTVDLARFEGFPAAVVVTERADGLQVRVVERSCGGPRSRLLGGPVPVP